MTEATPRCCPYCSCPAVSKTKEEGLMEIGGMELDEDEDLPVDIWVCDQCNRRFVILDEEE